MISDDSSGDAALAEIERAIAGDARFRLEPHEERVGFYRNFERALRAVPPEASYVALCDQDDRWHPDKLDVLLSALGPNDVLAHSDARVVNPDGHVVAETFGRAVLRATTVSVSCCSPMRSPVRPRCFRATRCASSFRSLSCPADLSTTAGPRWSVAAWAESLTSSARSTTTSSTRPPRTATRAQPGSPPPAGTHCASEPRIYAAAASTPTGGRRTMDTWRAPSRRRWCCVCASPSGSAPPTGGASGDRDPPPLPRRPGAVGGALARPRTSRPAWHRGGARPGHPVEAAGLPEERVGTAPPYAIARARR